MALTVLMAAGGKAFDCKCVDHIVLVHRIKHLPLIQQACTHSTYTQYFLNLLLVIVRTIPYITSIVTAPSIVQCHVDNVNWYCTDPQLISGIPWRS